nr:MAG TPA_asm: hypothetical protein [Caudoviricetes sp.]
MQKRSGAVSSDQSEITGHVRHRVRFFIADRRGHRRGGAVNKFPA